MDEAQFWSIVEESRELARQKKPERGQDFMTLHEQALAETLRRLSPAEISAFDERFWDLHQRAYRWDLWAAAYWLHGGCGNDGFTDFRASLISLGREWYDRILADPDSLAERVDMPDTPYMQSEGFQYIASRVYREKTGEDIPQDAPLMGTAPPKPAGTPLDHDDAEVMRKHFPKLVAKYPNMGD